MTVLATMTSFLLAGLIGFAAHRGGVCTVKAVAEVMEKRRAAMFASFAKTVAWVMVVSLPLVWLTGGVSPVTGAFPATLWGLVGGFVFGIGAAVNGACAISTVTRLGGGEFGLLLAVIGMAVGPALLAGVVDAPEAMPPVLVGIVGRPSLAVPITVALLGWAGYEGRRLWRSREPGGGAGAFLLTRRWSLALTAAAMGIANGLICALAGGWAYTSSLADGALWLVGAGAGPTAERIGLALAMVIGVVLSAGLRREFSPRWRPRWDWARHFVGGALMGVGTAMAPGGNDALILHGIPALSPHALPAYAALVAGIWLALMVTVGRRPGKAGCDHSM
ncbi:MAG: YeeE/YedE family protein [Magnetospirillum sp.]|nr:YeeE/YedE family protein [Magnetospirillum sp.]